MSGERSIDEITAELDAAVAARDVSVFDGASSPRAEGPASIDTILVGLAEASARRELADRLAAEARLDLRGWIAEALRTGVLTQAEIARRARVSRETVRQVTAG